MTLHPEQAFGKAVSDYFDLVLDPEQVLWTAINPVPTKSRAVAGLSKAMGLKAGMPDWLLVYNERAFMIELKDMSGSFTDSQRLMFPRIRRLKIPLATCRSLAEIDLALDAFGIPNKRVQVHEKAILRMRSAA